MTSVAAFDLGLSTLNRLRQKPRDALLHFARRLVGERHRQDVARSHAFFDEMRDARRDDARLARARPRQNQDRAVGGLGGLALRRIKRGKDGHG